MRSTTRGGGDGGGEEKGKRGGEQSGRKEDIVQNYRKKNSKNIDLDVRGNQSCALSSGNSLQPSLIRNVLH